MRYQACRWYDPYPRLAFALKLLYFSPKEHQDFAAREMIQLMDRYLGATAHAHKTNGKASDRAFKRWYDRSTDTAQLIERLKQSPDSLKTLFADKLISCLTSQPART